MQTSKVEPTLVFSNSQYMQREGKSAITSALPFFNQVRR